MAHFAELDENNVVLRVLVVPNEEEARGEEYLSVDCGLGGRWVQTSYNGKIRVRYAGIGFTYREDVDAFIRPQPYPDWTWNEETLDWDPPTAV